MFNTAHTIQTADCSGSAAGTSRVLVAYYSMSGTTAGFAKQLATDAHADLFRIENVGAYPTDYEEFTQTAHEELMSNERPAIVGAVDQMDHYETVVIGYPLWWDEAPMAVRSFVEEYDLTGKTVALFCTSANGRVESSECWFRANISGARFCNGLTAIDSADIKPWLGTINV